MRKNLQYHSVVKGIIEGLNCCSVPFSAAIGIAVSGGADSMALMRALQIIANKGKRHYKLHVLHVHHNQRDASHQEAQLVEDACQAWGLPFSITHLAIKKGASEAVLREERYRALAAMARAQDLSLVCVAHHATDVLETVIMRMAQGHAPQKVGLARQRLLDNFQPSLRLVRPLVALDKAQLLDFLSCCQQDFVEDESNPSTVRGMLRQEVLPNIVGTWPQALSSMSKHWLRANDVDDLILSHPAVLAKELNAWRALTKPMLHKCVSQYLADHGIHENSGVLQHLCNCIADTSDWPENGVCLPGHRRLALCNGMLCIQQDKENN